MDSSGTYLLSSLPQARRYGKRSFATREAYDWLHHRCCECGLAAALTGANCR
jgi:hypothetical protein